MSNGPERGSDVDQNAFARAVGEKAARKLKARKNPEQGVWFGLGMMGLIGWSVVVPMLLGAGAGLWLDARNPGRFSWTLALLVSGLCLGCLNAWRWMTKEHGEIQTEQEEQDE